MTVLARPLADQDWQAARRRIRSHWACVARLSDLAHESFMSIDLDGVALLLTRDREGTVRAFFNVCSHRGHALAEGGCRRGARISCPYHGWSYGLDGRLRGTAASGRAVSWDILGLAPSGRVGAQPAPAETPSRRPKRDADLLPASSRIASHTSGRGLDGTARLSGPLSRSSGGAGSAPICRRPPPLRRAVYE